MIGHNDQKARTKLAPALLAGKISSHLAPAVLDSLRRLIPDRTGTPAETATDPANIVDSRFRILRKISPVFLSLIVVVWVPAAIVAIYLLFIASDQFTAETHFAVRPAEGDSSPQTVQNLMSPASPRGAGSLPNLATQDAEIVASYIRSPAIISDISRTIDLRHYSARAEPTSGPDSPPIPHARICAIIG
jgi:hypothetical protein